MMSRNFSRAGSDLLHCARWRAGWHSECLAPAMSPLGFRESRNVATIKKDFLATRRCNFTVKIELCAKRIITISRIACDLDITKVCSKVHFAAYPKVFVYNSSGGAQHYVRWDWTGLMPPPSQITILLTLRLECHSAFYGWKNTMTN